MLSDLPSTFWWENSGYSIFEVLCVKGTLEDVCSNQSEVLRLDKSLRSHIGPSRMGLSGTEKGDKMK